LKPNRCLLLIEDEPFIADAISLFLPEYGYNVLLAIDGEAGVLRFQERRAEIDVVMCDLGLHKLSGLDVLKEIRRLDPEIPLILSSGFIDPQVQCQLSLIGVRHMIEKPVELNVIVNTLREIEMSATK